MPPFPPPEEGPGPLPGPIGPEGLAFGGFLDPQPPLVAGGEGLSASWEAALTLRRRHKKEMEELSTLLAAREETLRASMRRGQDLERLLREARQDVRVAENQSLASAIETQARLEAAMKAFREERERLEAEQATLKAMFEQSRKRIQSMESRFALEEKAWRDKEKDYAGELSRLEEKLSQTSETSRTKSQETERISAGLKEAKSALEKTLGELLREREAREQAEHERRDALKKVDELERHVEELAKIWEEERSEWRELWERERSSWQEKRLELEEWEGRLKKAGEEAAAVFGGNQEAQLRFASKIAESLRQSAEASGKITRLLLLLGGGALPESKLVVFKRLKKSLYAVAAAAALTAVSVWAVKALRAFHFRLLSSAAIASELRNPTALGFDGELLWVCDWEGRFSAFDPKSPALSVLSSQVRGMGPYHPSALAFGDGGLWSLDAAQSRLLKQGISDPNRVERVVAAPGAAPSALAFGEGSLWVLDAASRVVNRQVSEGAWKPYALNAAHLPSLILWTGGELWAYDPKAKALSIYRLKGSSLELAERHAFAEPVLGMAASASGKYGGRLWILTQKDGRYAIESWRYSAFLR